MANPAKLCGDCGVQMEVNPDLFALPGLDQTPNGLVFNTSRALPVTAYICPKCGRFKFISAVFLNNIHALNPNPPQQPQASGQGQASGQPQGAPQGMPEQANQ